jgi:hypothetical protein
MSDVCPNCGRPREIHELFAPPRCPVIRLSSPPTGEIVTYSKTAEYDDHRIHRALAL